MTDLESGVMALEDVNKEENGSRSSSTSSSQSRIASPTRREDKEEGEEEGEEEKTEADLDRTATTTSRLQQQTTNTISRLRSRNAVAPFDHPLTHEKTSPDVIVDFTGPDDPYRPMNWSFHKKAITTMLYGLTTMTTSFASSVYSPATDQIAHDFHVAPLVATIGISLLLLGMGLGPLLFGPLSELYGRKWVVLLPCFVAAMFSFGGGAAKDLQTLMTCRFFTGLFGSAPVTNTGGVLGDIWDPAQRGVAMTTYSTAVIGGAALGPVVGSAIVTSHLRWRWTQYITGIFQMLMIALDVLVLDESYPAALLVAKAKRLRYSSGNWSLHAQHEEWEPSLRDLTHKYLVRPFALLATPICALMVAYASFCYGLLYGCLAAFPHIFTQHRGWSPLVGSLPFLAILIGAALGTAVNVLNQTAYAKNMAANHGRPVPEARLYPMMLGGVLFTAGIFVFAWTCVRAFWVVPMLGVVLFGGGFYVIFQAALNYLVDTFPRCPASAIAANTFVRSVAAGAFPLFVDYQLDGIGVGWGMSVFGFVSALFIPVPFLFYFFGKKIRARGEWSKASV